VFHGFFFIVNLPLYRPQVLDLDLSNFEKITQVASGHATGDWLVKVLSIDFFSLVLDSSNLSFVLISVFVPSFGSFTPLGVSPARRWPQFSKK
jgi:hypothetical protein